VRPFVLAPRRNRNISRESSVAQVIFKSKKQMIERMVAMVHLVKVIRSRRNVNRTRRELNRAIANASAPAMRDELIMVAQRDGFVL
jgi:hypothetical protein